MTSDKEPEPQWRQCDFSNAEVRAGDVGHYVLEVSGEAKASELAPLAKLSPRVYVVQPDYWEIDVLERGDSPFNEKQRFTLTLPLDKCRGTKGIKVLGKRTSKQINVP